MPHYETLHESRRAQFTDDAFEWLSHQKCYKTDYLNTNSTKGKQPKKEESEILDATLISAAKKDGNNTLMFDIDRKDLYVHRSSSGNYHIGINLSIPDDEFLQVVKSLRDFGVYQHSNAMHVLDPDEDDIDLTDDEKKEHAKELGKRASLRTPWTMKDNAFSTLCYEISDAAVNRFGAKPVTFAQKSEKVEVAKGTDATKGYGRLSYSSPNGLLYIHLVKDTDGQVTARGFSSSTGDMTYFKPQDVDSMLDWLEFTSKDGPNFDVVLF